MVRYYHTLLIISLTVIAAIPLVDGAPYNTFIAISKSKTCEQTDCILVKDLIKYDTSNKKISGDFVLSPDGDYTRSKGMPNHLNWYYGVSPDRVVVFVEPDNKVIGRSKIITIVPDLKEYAPPTNLTKSELNYHTTKHVTYSGVYVDPKCKNALVGIKQYPDLKPIIEHLKSDCTTILKNKIEHITAKTKLNYCGQECQHQKFMKEAKLKAKQKLIIAGKA